MHCIKKLKNNLLWVGGSDRRLNLFENAYPVPQGISYNSYVLLDDKTVLFDTVDKAVSGLFFQNLQEALSGKALDYVIINHMEPDHCATLKDLILKYPEATIVANKKTSAMIKQFFDFDFDIESRIELIEEGDVLSVGNHRLTFYMMPMVHWPEAMVTFDETAGTLFSADAFGTFGAINGHIFADEVNFEKELMNEARRYYTNICGKYGNQVQAILKKCSELEIKMICPLHGPVWRENLNVFIEKYDLWSRYEPEEKGVIIPYGSIYCNTENAAEILAAKLADRGVHVKMYDTSKIHPSYIVSDAFKYSHIVFASSTYNAGIFVTMETLVHDIAAHNLQNRKISIIENGTWAATSGKKIRDLIEPLKGTSFIGDTLSIKSSLKESQSKDMDKLADAIADSVLKDNDAKPEAPKKGFVCTVCGYVYEGDSLPEGFTCPLCKAPADKFKTLD